MEEGTCEAGPNTWGGLFRQERIGKAFQERDQHIQRKNAMKWNTCLGNGPQFIKKRTLLFSCSVVFDSLWPHGLQHTRLPCPWPSPRVCSNPCPSSQWCHPTISSSVIPCSSCLPSFPASRSFPMSQSLHYVAKLSELQVQHQSFQWIFRTDFLWDWLVGSPCSPRNSQDSSPTPQFKSINSLAFSFLYSPTLTSICDHWKNHSLD